ncbi:MAG TPA: hypothetical protein PK156_49610, partial [Polyangium sp.]|nr:hypothetical protein [Polyangium sp.]
LNEAVATPWRRSLDLLGYEVHDESAVKVGDQRLVPCLGDWADVGVVLLDVVGRVWGLSVNETTDVATEDVVNDKLAVRREDEVHCLVVGALKNLGDRFWLGKSPLGLLLFPHVPTELRGMRLQEWLEGAIEATRGMRDGEEIEKALLARYRPLASGKSPTVEDAMTTAKMSRPTLHRKCKLGVCRIVELARQQIAATIPSAAA